MGKKLSDLTTRRVVILVLSMLIAQSFFASSTFQDEDTSYDTGFYMLQSFAQPSEEFNTLFVSMVMN